MTKLIGLLAFGMLAAFLAILVIHVPRLDLIAVVSITLLLAGWDMVMIMRGK